MYFIEVEDTHGQSVIINLDTVLAIRETVDGNYGLRCSNDFILFVSNETMLDLLGDGTIPLNNV